MITDYARLLQTLKAGGVEFILIGGVAANLHGSAQATFDVDVVYSPRRENLQKLVAALGLLLPICGVPRRVSLLSSTSGLSEMA